MQDYYSIKMYRKFTRMHKNRLVKVTTVSCFAMLLSMSAQLSQAGNAIGLTYASGFNDVADWHDNNLYADVTGIPIGISYRYIHNFGSGLRMDIGAGLFAIGGDISYYDLPLQATVGYSFFSDGAFKPYVRGGVSYHINNGDYVETSAGAGLLGALGVEIGSGRVNFFGEVAIDTAEATLSTAEGDYYYTRTSSKEEIAVSDVMFTMGVKF